MSTTVQLSKFLADAEADAIEIELPTGKPIRVPPAVLWPEDLGTMSNYDGMVALIGDVEAKRFAKAAPPAAFWGIVLKAKQASTGE